MLRPTIILIAIILTNAVFLFWKLGSVPVMSGNLYPNRFSSASAILLSSILIYFIAQKCFTNRKISLLSSFWFSFTPFSLGEARIASHITLPIFLVSIYLLVMLYWPRLAGRVLTTLFFLALLFIIYPSFWLFQPNLSFIHGDSFLYNLFKLISADFLFFHNDSLWWGGVREYGIYLLVALPSLVLGFFSLAIQNTYFSRLMMFSFVLIWIIAAFSPGLPESQEFLLTFPLMSLVLGLGTYQLINMLKNRQILRLMIILVLVGGFIYQLIGFSHFYFVHYALRFQNELSAHQTQY